MRLSVLVILLLFYGDLSAQADDSTLPTGVPQEYTTGGVHYDSTDSSEGETKHVLVDPRGMSTTRNYQSQRVSRKKFDTKKWTEIVGSANYNEKKQSPPFAMPRLPWAGALLRLVAYLVIAGIFILLIYFVIKNISFERRAKKSTVSGVQKEPSLEDIGEIDLDTLLEAARREKNFKMAVRLYYLSILKKLNAAGMIVWKKDKTNRDYLFELFSRNYYFDDIKGLTNSYEEVWYGEHVLDEESFVRLTRHFETVYQKINSVQNP